MNSLQASRRALARGPPTMPSSSSVAHFVYILRCADDSLYIGETRDVRRRLEQHRTGSACTFTRHRRPVSLACVEEHPTRLAALQRERQLKRWTRAKKEALISGDLQLLKRL